MLSSFKSLISLIVDITLARALGYKWLLILAMILGRIEIVAIFRALK